MGALEAPPFSGSLGFFEYARPYKTPEPVRGLCCHDRCQPHHARLRKIPPGYALPMCNTNYIVQRSVAKSMVFFPLSNNIYSDGGPNESGCVLEVVRVSSTVIPTFTLVGCRL